MPKKYLNILFQMLQRPSEGTRINRYSRRTGGYTPYSLKKSPIITLPTVPMCGAHHEQHHEHHPTGRHIRRGLHAESTQGGGAGRGEDVIEREPSRLYDETKLMQQTNTKSQFSHKHAHILEQFGDTRGTCLSSREYVLKSPFFLPYLTGTRPK